MAHVTFTYILLPKASDKVIHHMARRRDSKYLTTVFPPIWCHMVTKQYRAVWGGGRGSWWLEAPALGGLDGKTSWRRLHSEAESRKHCVWEGLAGAEPGEWQRTRNAKWRTAYLTEVWVHEGRNKERNLRADHAGL